MKYLKNSYRFIKHIIVIPIISSLIIPLIVADIWVGIYHRICFPLCNINYVKRNKYIQIDRHKLKYLNFIQKIYCIYCGYGNGLIQYWTKIAGETERYWCGLQHKKADDFISPEHHKDLLEYGNKEEFDRNIVINSLI